MGFLNCFYASFPPFPSWYIFLRRSHQWYFARSMTDPVFIDRSSLSFSTGSLPTFTVHGRSAQLLCSLLSCRKIEHFSGDHICLMWTSPVHARTTLVSAVLEFLSEYVGAYWVHIVDLGHRMFGISLAHKF